jgi:class 3 adenylate cyclase
LILASLAAILVYSGYHYPGLSYLRFLLIDFGLILFSIVISSLLLQSLHQTSYLIPIAVLGAALDLWSGFIGPTKELVSSGEVDYFLFRFPLLGTGRIPGFFGVSDLIFSAFFLFAAVKFKLNRFQNFIILQLAFIAIFGMVMVTDIAIPAIPFLSLGFIIMNWKQLEKSESHLFSPSFFTRKRPWLFSIILMLLMISVPSLKWFARYQIKQRINTINTLAKQSVDLAMEQYQTIIHDQQSFLTQVTVRDNIIGLTRQIDDRLKTSTLNLNPETTIELVSINNKGTYQVEHQWLVHPGTLPKLGEEWNEIIAQVHQQNKPRTDIGTVVVPKKGLHVVSFIPLSVGNSPATKECYLLLHVLITAEWLKNKIEQNLKPPLVPEVVIITRTIDPTSIDEWTTSDASGLSFDNGHNLPRFTDRDLNLSELNQSKYFFEQYLGTNPVKICCSVLPLTSGDCLLAVTLPYPLSTVTAIENYTQLSTSLMLLLATMLVVLLVLERGLKLTKKFVFALALATLLPIVIFRFAGFSTREALEEQISRHTSDGLLRAQRLFQQLQVETNQLARALTQTPAPADIEPTLHPYRLKYPHLLWAIINQPPHGVTRSLGTKLLFTLPKNIPAGLVEIVPQSAPDQRELDENSSNRRSLSGGGTIFYLEKFSRMDNNQNITAFVVTPFDDWLLERLKINSSAQVSFVWGSNHLISTVPRAIASAFQISEAELKEQDLLEVNSFTASRLQIEDTAYMVGYLRLPLAVYSSAENRSGNATQPALLTLAIPRTFVDEQIKEFDDNLMSFTILMLLVAGGIGLGLTLMTMRPLIQLIRGTDEVGRGNLEYQVNIQQRDEMGDLGRAFNAMVRLLKDRLRVRETFSKYVSEQVAEKILSHPEGVPLLGERRTITILYADIRGFTALAEHGNPEEIVMLLNDCFTRLIDIIFKYEGTLDKFMGDSVMALFGAPIAFPDSLERAIYAGLEMQEQMALFNQERKQAGRAEIQIGIGINYGEVIIGNVGSKKRLEYTAIGDNVNIAFRLQEIAEGGQILVTEECYSLVDDKFIGYPIGPITVKGKKKPITVVQITEIIKRM